MKKEKRTQNEAKTKSRYQAARRWLIFWTLFIGIGAVCGASGMLLDPSGKAMGMDSMLPYFNVLPFSEVLFQNLTFSGIALLIVNGLTNLTAAAFLLAKKPVGILLGGLFGVTLMLWICIQFYMFPLNFMSTIYFVFGLLQAITGYAANVFYKQERFFVNEADYPNIGTNPAELVVYFSRMGYTRKAALEEADRLGAQILEIKATEPTAGTGGFWWCGRYGMHKWDMPIESIDADLAGYEHVTICTPIWVFAVSSPIRSFCRQASGQLKAVSYILVHYQKSLYKNAVSEMNALLGCRCDGAVSICCRMGKTKMKTQL